MSFSSLKKLIVLDDRRLDATPLFGDYIFSEEWCWQTNNFQQVMMRLDQNEPTNTKIYLSESTLTNENMNRNLNRRSLIQIFDVRRVHRVCVFSSDPDALQKTRLITGIDPRYLDVFHENDLIDYLCTDGIRYFEQRIKSSSTLPNVYNAYLIDIRQLRLIQTNRFEELSNQALAIREGYAEKYGHEPQ